MPPEGPTRQLRQWLWDQDVFSDKSPGFGPGERGGEQQLAANEIRRGGRKRATQALLLDAKRANDMATNDSHDEHRQTDGGVVHELRLGREADAERLFEVFRKLEGNFWL